MTSVENDDPSTPEERLNWLRERGVQIETSEERKQKTKKGVTKENEEVFTTVSFVRVPHDSSKAMVEITVALTESEYRSGDNLPRHLKHHFSTLEGSGEDVDLELLRSQQQGGQQHLLSSGVGGEVSDSTMRRLAAEGQIEIFPLVRPAPSNQHTGVNVYLDEVGLLKRLPLNSRAADLAARAGYDPPPTFYGDVFLGRVKSAPTMVNKDFKLGEDTSPDAPWLKAAVTENLEHQARQNAMTGGATRDQPSNAGENGVAAEEDKYRWTQTEEEVEMVVPVGPTTTAKDVEVVFRPKSVRTRVKTNHEKDFAVDLFAAVDPDGCTWTLDKALGELVITCEKSESVSWPRITF